MTNHSGISKYTTPLTGELEALFKVIPDEELLARLKVYYAGRRGYTHKVLWRTYVAMTFLSIPSFAALVRMLQDNPALREVCGIASFDGVPSPFAYSRFMRKLQKPQYVVLVKNVLRSLVRKCYDTFPEFGKVVAVDSSDMKAWSNGKRKPPTDPDAGWVVKQDTQGKKKFVWGYKMHMLADTTYELPIAAVVTAGNVHDVTRASYVLREARYTYSKFNPSHVICDKGYCSDGLRYLIRRQYGAVPLIKPNPAHKKAMMRTVETEEWKALYNRRTSEERLFGRLKCHRRLNNITVRRIRKVTIHGLMSLIVTQAQALAVPDSPRQCVRAAQQATNKKGGDCGPPTLTGIIK